MWGVTERILPVPLPGDLQFRTRWVSHTELIIEIDENLGRVARTDVVLRARQDAKADRPPAGHSKTRLWPFLLPPAAVFGRRLAGAANSAPKMHIAVATFTAGGAVVAGMAVTATPSPHHPGHHRRPAAASSPPAAASTGRQASPLTDGHGSHQLRHPATTPSPTTAPSPTASASATVPVSSPPLLPSSVPLPSLPLGGLLPSSLPLPPLGSLIPPGLRHLLHGLTGASDRRRLVTRGWRGPRLRSQPPPPPPAGRTQETGTWSPTGIPPPTPAPPALSRTGTRARRRAAPPTRPGSHVPPGDDQPGRVPDGGQAGCHCMVPVSSSPQLPGAPSAFSPATWTSPYPRSHVSR